MLKFFNATVSIYLFSILELFLTYENIVFIAQNYGVHRNKLYVWPRYTIYTEHARPGASLKCVSVVWIQLPYKNLYSRL